MDDDADTRRGFNVERATDAGNSRGEGAIIEGAVDSCIGSRRSVGSGRSDAS